MNVKVKCELCDNMVILTSSYRGQEIWCKDCTKSHNEYLDKLEESLM